MYNKSQFNKLNDKKVLHKVKKNWVTISVAMLGLIGGGAVATNVTANADTNNNQNNNVNQNTVKQNLNRNLASNSSHLQKIQPQQNSNANNSIAQQANALHSHILASNFSQSNHVQQSQSAKSNQNVNSASANNSDSKVLSNQTQNVIGQTEKAPMNEVGDKRTGSYGGLSYNYDPATKTVEFTSGSLTWTNPSKTVSDGFITGSNSQTPADLKNAEHIKFDDDVTTNIYAGSKYYHNYIIANDPNVKTINLGKNFDVAAPNADGGYGNDNMFVSDVNLQTITVPNYFVNSYDSATNVFHNDRNLFKITVLSDPTEAGWVPKMQFASNNGLSGNWYTQSDFSSKSNSIQLGNGSTPLTSGKTYMRTIEHPDFTHDTFKEGGATVKYDTNSDKIIISNGALADTHDNSSAALPTQIVDTTKGFNVNSDMLPNADKTWTLTFNNVTAPSDLFFTLDGKNESTGLHNFIGNQVTNVDLSGLKTGNTTNMEGLLINNPNLRSVNFGNINTSKVTNMSMMLGSDPSLTTADLSNLSGQSLNQAWDMFDTDPNLQSVTLNSKFSPQGSNVNLGEMFASDPSLTTINWNGFNTQNANQIYGMFRGDKSLANASNNYTIKLPSTFDTSNVWNMGTDVRSTSNPRGRDGLFQSDFAKSGHAGTIDLSTDPNFNLKSAKSLQGLFSSDKSLTNINFGNNFDTSKVSDMRYMFGLSDGISDLSLPASFNTSKAIATSINDPKHGSQNGMYDMFLSDIQTAPDTDKKDKIKYSSNGTAYKLGTLTINSSNTKIDPSAWGDDPAYNLYLSTSQKDSNGNLITKTGASANDFSKGNVGTYTLKNLNQPEKGTFTDRIVFETSDGTPVNQTYIYGSENETTSVNSSNNGYSDSNDKNLDFNIPNGYSLSQAKNHQGNSINPSSIAIGNFNNPNDKSEFRTHVLIVDGNTSSDIPIGENAVDLEGTVTLHFRNSNGTTITNIPLNYFTQAIPKQSPVNVLKDLNLLSGNQSNSIAKPSDLLKGNVGNAIENLYNGNSLNLNGFTYDENTSHDTDSSHPYDITIDANNDNYFHGSTPVQQNNVDLYFTAKPVSQKINYVYRNSIKGNDNTTNSNEDTGLSDQAYNSTDAVSSLKNVPAGYSISNDNPSNVTINGGTTDINVVPDQKIVNVEYDNNNTKVGSDKNLNVHTGSDIEPNNVPTGYHVTPNQKLPLVVTANDNNTNNPIKVSVLPNTEHEMVNYYYSYGSKNILVGSAYLTGAYKTVTNINDSNKPGLNSSYSLKYGNNKFTYGTSDNDNGNTQSLDSVGQDVINVAVTPNTESTSYQFVTPISNNGETVVNGKDGYSTDGLNSGNPSDAITVKSNNSITSNLPTGYHFVDSDQQIPYDNKIHSILITPNHVTDKVNFMINGGSTSAGSPTNVSGLYSDSVNPGNVPNVPTGYHITPNQHDFKLSDDTAKGHNISVTPNTEHEVINYYYKGSNGKKVLAGVDYKTGTYGQTDKTIQGDNTPGLDSGYRLVSNSANDNSFTYGQNGDVANIKVEPIQQGTTITFVTPESDGGNNYDTVGSVPDISNGNPSDTITMSDNEIQNNIPSHYHIVDVNQLIYHDGHNHDIVVAPDAVTDTITYKSPSDNNKGTAYKTGLYNDKFSPNTLNNIPSDYHLQPGQPDIDLDGTNKHSVTIDPNQYKDTIIYVDHDQNKNNGNTLGSYTTTAGNFNTTLSGSNAINYVNGSIHNLPTGYNLVASDTTPSYDGQTHVIWVTGNLVGPGNKVRVDNTKIPKHGAGQATTKPSNTDPNRIYYVHVHINGYGLNDKTTHDDEYIPISGNVGSDVVLDPINYGPDGSYSMSSSDQNANVDIVDGNQGLNVSGSNWKDNTITWNYHQAQQNNNITVEYVNGEGSKQPILETGVISGSNNAYGNVSDKVPVPNGYSIIQDNTDNDQSGNPKYKLTNTPQTYIIHVQGNKITDNNMIHVTEIYKNKRNVTYSSEHDVAVSNLTSLSSNDESASDVGRHYLVNIPASEHTGYSDRKDTPLRGVITPNGVSHASVTFVYNAAPYNGISLTFKTPSGQAVPATGTVSGTVDSDVDPNSVLPKGYHVISGQHPKVSSNGTVDPILVQGDGVVGQAQLTLRYENGNQIIDQKTISVPINGRIGDNPQTISPWNPLYGRENYKLISSDNSTSNSGGVNDWSIPFDANAVESNGNTDAFRYTPTNTFTYQATPIDIQVKYIDVDDGNKAINTDNLGAIGIKGQTLDLKKRMRDQSGSNQPNNSDNYEIVNVNGHNYHLTIPAGYHLINSDNYMTIMPSKNTNGTIKTTTVNGQKMPVMMLALGLDTGATPAEPNKPASSSANNHSTTPASNGGSVAPSNNGSNGSSSAGSNNGVPSTPSNNGSNSASSSNSTPNQPNQPASNNSNHSGSANSDNGSHANQPAKSAGNKGNSVSPSSNGSSSAGSNGNVPNRPNIPNNAGNDDHSHSASNGGSINPINPNPSPQPSNNGGNDQPVNPGNNIPNNGGNVTPGGNGNVIPSNNNNDGDNVAPSNTPIAPVNPMPNPQPTPSSLNNNSNGSRTSIGQVVVTYVDGENHVINRTSVDGMKGSAFQPANYTSLAPSGYQVDHIITGGNISSFNNGAQNLVVQVDKNQDQQSASASDNTPQLASASNSSDNLPAASSSDPNTNDITPASSSVAPSSSSSSSSSSDSATSDSESNPGSTSNHSSNAKPASSSSQRNSAANSNNSDGGTSSDADSDSDDSSDSNSDVPSDPTSDTGDDNTNTGKEGATDSTKRPASTTGNGTDGGTTNNGDDNGTSTGNTTNTGADDAVSNGNEAGANGTNDTSTNNDANGSNSTLPQTGENNYSKDAALAMLGLDAIIGGLGLGRKRRRHDE